MPDDQKSIQTKSVSLAEIEPVLREVLAAGGRFRITITGTSMMPTLREGRDQVELSLPDRPYRKYDLPLYKRSSGQFVLHRVISLEKDGSLSCCGDNQWIREPGLQQSQMLGLVVRICRNGREFPVEDRRYRLWVRFWVLVFPCRRLLLRAYHGLALLRRKLRGKSN